MNQPTPTNHAITLINLLPSVTPTPAYLAAMGNPPTATPTNTPVPVPPEECMLRAAEGDFSWNRNGYSEGQLIAFRPVEAATVGGAAGIAQTWTSSTFALGTSLGDAYNTNNGQGDGSDAARHALFSCLLTKALDSTKAKEWGNAHEVTNFEDGDIASNNYMDLYNNKAGRILSSGGSCEDSVLSALNNGDLLFPSPGGSGGTNPDGTPAPSSICS